MALKSLVYIMSCNMGFVFDTIVSSVKIKKML